MMDMQRKIEDRYGQIMLSPCQFPRDINGTAGRMFRILWIDARAAGAEFGTGVGIGIRMSAGYSNKDLSRAAYTTDCENRR